MKMKSVRSFLSLSEVSDIGFASFGDNVLISRSAMIYSPHMITLGSNVRIDDFCVISGWGGITIGNYIHISCASLLYGGGSIIINDFCSVSSRCAIYSQSDDFTGETPANPMIPDHIFRNVTTAPVILEKHVLIGTGSTLLPGVTLRQGVAVGAHSLVTKDLEEWTVYAGIPARPLHERSKKLLSSLSEIS